MVVKTMLELLFFLIIGAAVVTAIKRRGRPHLDEKAYDGEDLIGDFRKRVDRLSGTGPYARRKKTRET